jgi:hypothetical protein
MARRSSAAMPTHEACGGSRSPPSSSGEHAPRPPYFCGRRRRHGAHRSLAARCSARPATPAAAILRSSALEKGPPRAAGPATPAEMPRPHLGWTARTAPGLSPEGCLKHLALQVARKDTAWLGAETQRGVARHANPAPHASLRQPAAGVACAQQQRGHTVTWFRYCSHCAGMPSSCVRHVNCAPRARAHRVSTRPLRIVPNPKLQAAYVKRYLMHGHWAIRCRVWPDCAVAEEACCAAAESTRNAHSDHWSLAQPHTFGYPVLLAWCAPG